MAQDPHTRAGHDGEELPGSSPSASAGGTGTGSQTRRGQGSQGPAGMGPGGSGAGNGSQGQYGQGSEGQGGSGAESAARGNGGGGNGGGGNGGRKNGGRDNGGQGRPAGMAGFRDGGAADVLAPGPELAVLMKAAAGALGTLTDEEVLGMLAAGQRLGSWAAWLEMSALAEFADRRADDKRPGIAAAAADEAGFKTRMTWTSAQNQMAAALTGRDRLPATFAALGAGRLDRLRLKIIAEQTAYLSPEDAAKADVLLAAAAQTRTWGQLTAFAARLVARLDPAAAQRRKDAGRRQANVRIWQESSGNGGLSARELPADELLAGWQNIEQRALDLRAAGVEGSLRELQVMATLDLLLERDSRPAPAAGTEDGAGPADAGSSDSPDDSAGPPDDSPGDADPGEDGPRDDGPGDGGWDDGGPDDGGPDDGGPDDGGPDDGGPDDGGPDWLAGEDGHDSDSDQGDGEGGRGGAGAGRGRASLAAQPVIVIPWDAFTGGPSPAEVPGFGYLDPQVARDLVAAAGRDPRTRVCVTVTGPDGTAIAEGCAPGRHDLGQIWAEYASRAGGGGGERAGPVPPGGPGPSPEPPPGSRNSAAADLIARLKVRLAPIARGTCDHHSLEPQYRPSRKLQHLVRARNLTCTAPGCAKPAVACDLDHTIPWEKGGITCECDLGPACRHHHQVKQTKGWMLEQPEPGVLIWTTPAGIQYTTGPTDYRD
jgi:Domain of unknown function (DUF222)